MSKLEDARREIDSIDSAMAELFCRRMVAAKAVAMHKTIDYIKQQAMRKCHLC